MPRGVRRVLDLGTGDGRLLARLLTDRPEMLGVGVDFSELMLGAARERFAGDERVELVEHDLAEPLPALGRFDAVVSSFATITSSTSASVRSTARSSSCPSRPLDVETQLTWLRELGFDDVDCYWKWLEMALLIGVKPAAT